ncbi:hypothetical protein OEG86_23840 [Hoeflea alexandrii]|uniref:hypothetical protein n=1 Tax=Hoeflea alexandrii TaxID=288436 RepID=UPI0022714A12|nr:hypothetical protein [Hoeflea alexandrii]MCY0154748.1 hypothetical protein [Hoeflea alexandrii]
MPSATIEFTVGQYQSAFQLAAALNFGLSIFRQLRQPSQEAAISQANSVLELARRSSDWADSKMRAMEEAAKNKCVEAGGNPDTEFVIYLDQKGYDLATQKMVDTAELENDVLQVSWEIDKKESIGTELMKLWSGQQCFSLSFLFFAWDMPRIFLT